MCVCVGECFSEVLVHLLFWEGFKVSGLCHKYYDENSQKPGSAGAPLSTERTSEFNGHIVGCRVGFGMDGGGRFCIRLGHAGAACRRGAHLGENLVQPLQGPV